MQIYRDMALESDVQFGVVWSGRGDWLISGLLKVFQPPCGGHLYPKRFSQFRVMCLTVYDLQPTAWAALTAAHRLYQVIF